MICPTCNSPKGFVSKLVIVGRERDEDVMQEKLVCRGCRQSIDGRRGPRGRLALEDDINGLTAKYARSKRESLRRVLVERKQRLAREYGTSD